MHMIIPLSRIFSKQLYRAGIVSALAIIIASCGGAPTKPTEPTPSGERPSGFPSTIQRPEGEAAIPPTAAPSDIEAQQRYKEPAKHLIKLGRYLDAALLLSELAATVGPPHRQEYQLQIASLLLQGNYLLQAEQILGEINVTGLDNSYHVRKTLLAAQLSLANQQPEVAVSQLDSIASVIASTSPQLQKDFFNKRQLI